MTKKSISKTKIQERKNSHLDHCLNSSVEFYSEHAHGFSAFRFEHDALPEIDFDSISLDTEIFGKKLKAPFLIGAMTGGTKRAKEINLRLAKAAEKSGVGLSLGSQRPMLIDPKSRSSYAVREKVPSLPLLIGNLGAVQLNHGVGLSQVHKLIDETQCDAFYFHLNPLQEAIQPEGNRDFSSLHSKLRDIIPNLPVPILIKEVGAGISTTTALKLKSLPLAGIETAGLGGTSWAKIESLRAQDSNHTLEEKVGELFSHWGIPTAESVIVCKKHLPHLKIIASGGIRNGIEAAKAIALGADLVAFALPALKAAEHSSEKAFEFLEQLKRELQTALFVTGISSIVELKKRGSSVLKRL